MGEIRHDYLLAIGAGILADAAADDFFASQFLLEVCARAWNVLFVLGAILSRPVDAESITAYITTASFFLTEFIGTSL